MFEPSTDEQDSMAESFSPGQVGIVNSSSPGQAFSAGADLKEVSRGVNINGKKGGFAGIVRYPRTKPLIAAVDGPALAGGCEIMLSCDLVVASARSRFGLPEVKRSLVAGAGGVFRLPRQLPQRVALELVLTGDPIPAARGYELGFVNIVVADPSKVDEAAMRLAHRITVNAPIAVRQSLKLVRESAVSSEEENWKQTNDAFKVLIRTEDYFEGPRAFVEKRAPKWTGKFKSKI